MSAKKISPPLEIDYHLNGASIREVVRRKGKNLLSRDFEALDRLAEIIADEIWREDRKDEGD